MDRIIEEQNANDLQTESTGAKILKVPKFIFLTLIKMIFVVLSVAALGLAVFGVVFKIVQELCKGGYIKTGGDNLIAILSGFLAAACFFLVKFFHSVLRPYFWPAVAGLIIVLAAAVAVAVLEPDLFMTLLK